jgi:hypothetical protein
MEPFLVYRNDPDVARYQSWEGCSRTEAETFILEAHPPTHRRSAAPSEIMMSRLPYQLSVFCYTCGTIAVSSPCCSGGRTCDHACLLSSH